jgi:hypothetical protein
VRGRQAAAPELPEPLGAPPPRQEAEVAMPAANLESLENFGTRALSAAMATSLRDSKAGGPLQTQRLTVRPNLARLRDRAVPRNGRVTLQRCHSVAAARRWR